MTNAWLVVAGILLLVATALLIASYSKLRTRNFLIRLQSREIERQIRELVAQNSQAQDLVREKKQLILLVSHDLKGPFNRLYALMQLMEMSSENLTAEQKEYLGKMYQIVGDGLNMVRNLVDVRRLEERGVDPQPEKIKAASIITAIVNQYRVSADKKSITIHFDGPTFEFITDRNYLSRIMENLLSNAIKFSSQNKKVFVTLRQSGDDEIEISVQDEGPGLSTEDQQKLFQRFQKLTARPTGGESSTGLGLSIVKQLVTSMGGNITCKSALEEGATFTVRLPAMKITPASQEEQAEKIQLNK